MRILITGGTGLIGSHLIPILYEHNKLIAYTRNVAMAERILSHKIELHSSLSHFKNLDEFDAVINLAGEPIVNKRWSDKQKEIIEKSRWDTTEKLVSLFKSGSNPPGIFISGSAIGYYGRQGDVEIDEDFTDVHDEFSHTLCKKWEEIALQVQSEKTRVCVLRTGIVLSRYGGALEKMVPMFKLGLGGPIGNGEQYMSWIHIQDMLNAILHLMTHEECRGVFNLTAPEPVTNAAFAKRLAEKLKKPYKLTMPAFVLKIMMGEMSDLLVHGQRVVPKKLLASGFEFQYNDIVAAFESFPLTR